ARRTTCRSSCSTSSGPVRWRRRSGANGWARWSVDRPPAIFFATGRQEERRGRVMATIAEARAQMEKALEAVRREFASVRTGKATPALLDTVRVEAYGSKLPLNQVATVSAPEPRMLVIQPWDKGLLSAIE